MKSSIFPLNSKRVNGIIKNFIVLCLMLNCSNHQLFTRNEIIVKKGYGKPKTEFTFQASHIRKLENASQNVLTRNYDRIKHDAAGRIKKIISKDCGETEYIYNELGKLRRKIKSNGESENYYYDILGRRVKIEYQCKKEKDVVEFKYSTPEKSYKLGNLIEKIEQTENCFYKYNERGLAEETKVINGYNFEIKYCLNEKRRLSELHYPSGLIVSYEYGDDNNIRDIFIKKGKDCIKVISYEKDKNSSMIKFGNGHVTRIVTDLKNRELSIITGNFQNLTAKYNDNGLISKVFDKVDIKNKREFYYDKNERLSTTYGPYGKIGYRYDNMDNLKKVDGDIKMELSYDKMSSRIKELKIRNKKLNIRYDKLGRMINYKKMRYEYNTKGRLSRILKKGELISEIFYNVNNQRIFEKNNGNDYYYIYDNQNRILAKYKKDKRNKGKPKDRIPILMKEYIYRDSIPVGFISNGQFYYYHYDMMNFPIKITDSYGRVVRSIQYKPYGEIIKPKGIINDNLRFPGQFKIEGTKIFYNLNRTYNPEISRYLEPDPIINNENIYQYALSNPVKFVDVEGKRINRYYSDKTINFFGSTTLIFFRVATFEGQYTSECTEEHPNYSLPRRIHTNLANDYFAAKFIAGGISFRYKPRQFSWTDFHKWLRAIPGGMKFKISFESVDDLFKYPQAKELKAKKGKFEMDLNFDKSDYWCQVGNIESISMTLVKESVWNIPTTSTLTFKGKVVYAYGPYDCCWEKI
jgi:RHS repeat-associated protein